MCEARDRLDGAPQAFVRTTLEQDARNRLEAVAFAIYRVPERHQAARFGEEQKQHAIQHRERLLP